MPRIPAKLKVSLKEAMSVTFPPAMSSLLQEATSANPDFNNLAKIIATDPGLTVTILSLITSPYYSLQEKVTDLKRAAVILGTKEILKIALSVTFHKNLSLKFQTCEVLKFRTWRQTVWGAVAGEVLAQKLSPKEADKVYTAGLLKDLSLFLICCVEDEEVEDFTRICYDGDNLISLKKDQLRREVELWGIEHPQITQALLKSWNFPLNGVFGAIKYHHAVDRIEEFEAAIQCLILGTLWAEAEFEDKDSSILFKLKAILKNIAQIEEEEFNNLRSTIKNNVNSICETLSIKEDKEKICFYTLPLEKIQNFSHLLQEVDTASDLQEIAQILGRHFYWLWNIRDFRITLRSPITGEETFFEFKAGKLTRTDEPASPSKECSKSCSFTLEVKGEKFGCICFEKLEASLHQEVALYVSLFRQRFENFFYRHLETSGKALVLDLLPVGIIRLNKLGKVLQLNAFAKQALKVKSELRGLSFKNILSNIIGLDLGTEWDNFLTRKVNSFSRLYCPLGPEAEVAKSPCFNFSASWITLEGVEQILVIVQDIQEIASLESEIVYQKNFLSVLVSSMQDVVLTVDKEGQILFTSPSLDHLKGKNFFDVSTPSSALSFIWGPRILEESVPFEIKLALNGETLSLEIVISPIRESATYLLVGRNLTLIKRLEQKIREQAVFDHLSRVYNRHQLAVFLEREVQRAKRQGKKVGVIFFDLDKFKNYNDLYGHQQGDEAIRRFGRILIRNSRQGVDFPCRYGGDEFVLLASEVEEKTLEVIARRVRSDFDKEFKGELSLSIGLALLKEGETGEQMVSRADEAAYKAKAQGGNKIVWG